MSIKSLPTKAISTKVPMQPNNNTPMPHHAMAPPSVKMPSTTMVVPPRTFKAPDAKSGVTVHGKHAPATDCAGC